MKKVNLFLCTAILIIMSTLTAFIRIEGKSVKRSMINEVKIGNQIWTSKNLNVTTYRNGDVIPEVQDQNTWAKLTTGAWCYYNNDASNGTKYGKLYNWYAVNDPRGLASNGFHIPSDAEWTILTNYLGENSIAGTKMKSTSGWSKDGNGTNSSGFSGLPGGSRFGNDSNGKFYTIDSHGYWWSSTERGTYRALGRELGFYNGIVSMLNPVKESGYSVRCIKD